MPDNDDLMDGLNELSEARDAYQDAESYYKNDMLERFVGPRMRAALRQTDISYRVRLAKIPVDVVANRLEVASVTVPDQNEATKVLERHWDDNNMLLEMPNILAKKTMFGDAYVIVWPNLNENDDATVDYFYNSPLNARMVYDPENRRRKLFMIKEWAIPDSSRDKDQEIRRANILYEDRITRWTTKPGSKGEDASDWMEFTDPDDEDEFEDDGHEIPNPYGEVPAFHFRNGTPYGTPEHEAAYGPQDAINKLVITQMATIDYQGFPQRYGLEDILASQGGSDEAAEFGDEDEDAISTRPGSQSAMESGPGEFWWLKGLREVGQFSVADSDAFLKPLDRHVRLMASVTETPLHYFDPMGDSPSGEALRAKEGPLVKRIINRRQFDAATISDMFGFGLRIDGFKDLPKVDTRWTAPAILDDLDGWKAMQIKAELGVPWDQLLLEAGYSHKQIAEWRPRRESETDSGSE